jgi:hypothetical protein
MAVVGEAPCSRRCRCSAAHRVAIPTDSQIRALHERHAPTPEAFELVHTHCEIVCAKVRRFGEDKATLFTAMVEQYGEPDLTALADRYGHALT